MRKFIIFVVLILAASQICDISGLRDWHLVDKIIARHIFNVLQGGNAGHPECEKLLSDTYVKYLRTLEHKKD